MTQRNDFEARVRELIDEMSADSASELVDIVAILCGLGNIIAQVTALMSDNVAKSYLDNLMDIREKWKSTAAIAKKGESVNEQILTNMRPGGNA